MRNKKPTKKRRMSIAEDLLRCAENEILNAVATNCTKTGLRMDIRATLRWFRRESP